MGHFHGLRSRVYLFLPVVAVSILALAIACGAGASPTRAPTSQSIPINVKPHSGQIQSGTAVLTAKGEETEVVLNLSAGPAGAGIEQPVHIHSGSCATLGGVVHPLTNLKGGKSTTTVKAKLDTITTGKFAINAHKSGQEASVYTACGDIPAKMAALTPESGSYEYGY